MLSMLGMNAEHTCRRRSAAAGARLCDVPPTQATLAHRTPCAVTLYSSNALGALLPAGETVQGGDGRASKQLMIHSG